MSLGWYIYHMDGNSPDISELRSQVDVRKISKAHDPQGRDQTARMVGEARAEVRSNKAATTQHEQELEQIGETRRRIAEVERETAEKLEDRLDNKLVKLKLAIGFGDKAVGIMQSQISELEQGDTDLLSKSFEARRELEKVIENRDKLPNPKDILNAYYEKVAVTPLTNEEKRELLAPEALAQLTEQEYITLWRRLNPHFLTHVTRQGFRDHTGNDIMVNHHSGQGEFINGFVDVMGNGRSIFPPLARIGLINRDEATAKSFLQAFLKGAPDAEKAKQDFLGFLKYSMASAPTYPDITATHFAAQIVSDQYYGGENNNEVFFVYPSDVIASQYAFAFNGWEKDFTQPQSETKWNDVFIWTDPSHPGVPVDLGMVFLPEKVPVDPQTGSKYASEVTIVDGKEKRVMIEDTSLVKSFVEWGKKLDNQSPLKQASTEYKSERGYYRQQDLERSWFGMCIKELQGLGMAEDVQRTVASRVFRETFWRESLDDETLGRIIRESSAQWKRAESTVSAKEYWEGFFAKNPNLRPKHVQYYNGDPTTAVYKFQQQNDIGRADTSKTDGQLLGFDDHHVLDMEKDPRARVGYDELVAMGEKIIEDHYKT